MIDGLVFRLIFIGGMMITIASIALTIVLSRKLMVKIKALKLKKKASAPRQAPAFVSSFNSKKPQSAGRYTLPGEMGAEAGQSMAFTG